MLPAEELVDEVGDELPTRDRLARCYGPAFTALVFDDVLPSFPSEARHLAFGVDEARLMPNIYPWFFPRAVRPPAIGDESRAFHDRLRGGIEQRVLYPRTGGFGGFAEGFARHFDPSLVDVLVGADDLAVEVCPGTHTIEQVSCSGRRFTAAHYFWAGAWSPLCSLLGLPCQPAATDRVLLGSFRLNHPARTSYHEVLVGDRTHHVNRIHFPAAFRESTDPLVQIEFAVPGAADWPTDPAWWSEQWVGSLSRLELIGDDHRVEEFDFRSFPMHFNAFGAEGEPLRDADPGLLRADTNVRPVVPSMANLNLNRYVPRAVRYVADVIGRSGVRFDFERDA
jgi:hypothetical protein